MEKKTMELSWPDILKIASGKDPSGLPRSAGSLSIDRILNEKETEALKEYFLGPSVFNVHVSGGAAVITIDFPYDHLYLYKQCRKVCENWLKDTDCDSSLNQQLSLCIAPYALEGQIVLFYNQLMFVDGYDTDNKEARLILGFDNNVTVAMESEDINYNQIQAQISEELRYYEQQIDEEIAQAIEEEKAAKEQENIMEIEMQKKLNNPLADVISKEQKVEDSDSVRFVEENEGVRFSDDD